MLRFRRCLTERLFTYLSRFCKAPYCVKRHTAFLLGAGNVAGDSGCAAMTPEEVVDTLQSRLPGYTEVSRCLTIIEQLEAPFGQWGEDAEDALFPCLAAVFLRSEGAGESERELQRLFGSALYDRLVWFLGFIKTAHFWTETHPELELEADSLRLIRRPSGICRGDHALTAAWQRCTVCGRDDSDCRRRRANSRFTASVARI
ncbi:MAG: hypothetical protein ACI8P0_001219 [Planctomycetaceae bacterium]|jgi:hypothetical protein